MYSKPLKSQGDPTTDNYYLKDFSNADNKNYCGSCGFDLNLSSSSRNTSAIGSKYGKSIKKGIISFVHIDESRFTQLEKFQCIPYFISKQSWGLFQRKTKLMCRKCGNYIGVSYDDNASTYPIVSDGLNSASGSEISVYKRYDVRIRALQPSSSATSGIASV
ncbi:hypothetical protein DCAR_0519063 [Daucus carota subsp. sativus]|uniref:Uncharacterized protein n=1 Tax=Daucus carota subsp. sativus TaxID=79200 RepID=A0AAF0X3Q2_DAUCS|nr:hypothetical protein DCAR_0519063 [Daucus carota subsp. sativus]